MTQTHVLGLSVKACGLLSLAESAPNVARAMAVRLTELDQSGEPPIAWSWSSVPAAVDWADWVSVAIGVLLLWLGERIARRYFQRYATRCESCDRELPIIGEHKCSTGADSDGPRISERGFLRYALPLVGICAIARGIISAPLVSSKLLAVASTGYWSWESDLAIVLATAAALFGLLGLGAGLILGRDRISRMLIRDPSTGRTDGLTER